MIKTFAAACFVCLGIGSTLGFVINEQMRSPISQAQPAPIQPAPKPLERNELERRFIVCIGRNVKLLRYSDKGINDELFECERQKQANSNR